MQARTETRLPLQHLEQLNLNRGMEKKPAAAAPEKKNRQKLSSLCKTPPSTIKGRGKNFQRGLCLGEVGSVVLGTN